MAHGSLVTQEDVEARLLSATCEELQTDAAWLRSGAAREVRQVAVYLCKAPLVAKDTGRESNSRLLFSVFLQLSLLICRAWQDPAAGLNVAADLRAMRDDALLEAEKKFSNWNDPSSNGMAYGPAATSLYVAYVAQQLLGSAAFPAAILSEAGTLNDAAQKVRQRRIQNEDLRSEAVAAAERGDAPLSPLTSPPPEPTHLDSPEASDLPPPPPLMLPTPPMPSSSMRQAPRGQRSQLEPTLPATPAASSSASSRRPASEDRRCFPSSTLTVPQRSMQRSASEAGGRGSRTRPPGHVQKVPRSTSSALPLPPSPPSAPKASQAYSSLPAVRHSPQHDLSMPPPPPSLMPPPRYPAAVVAASRLR